MTDNNPNNEYRETVIHGYKVELDFIDDPGGIVSDCGVSITVGHGWDRKEFGCSLACLEGTGGIECYDTGDFHNVPERTVNAIFKWAEANGY